MIFHTLWLSLRSLGARKLSTFLTILTLSLTVSLYMLIGRIKSASEQSFLNTVSKVDLIVGAKGGSLELLLYSVFHLGSATNNISYKAYEKYEKNPQVSALIPISLGDSHQGYRVVGTNQNFFEFYRFQGDGKLEFDQGAAFNSPLEVVLGNEVARDLKYKIGQEIFLSHGVDESGLLQHDEMSFKVTGIMKTTHTPIDRSVYVPLLGLEAIHADWQEGYKKKSDQKLDFSKLQISSLTAFMVIAKNRVLSLFLRQAVSTDTEFSLMAIIPGIELSNMWQALSYLEKTLNGISALTIFIGFLSMMIVLFHSLESRRREMAIYRTLGASPFTILNLLLLESGALSIGGALLGLGLSNLLCYLGRPYIYQHFGLYLNIPPLTENEFQFLISFMVVGTLLGLIPALKAYRNSLRDGLMVKL